MSKESNLVIIEIQKRNRRVFENLFHEYREPLGRFANGYLFDQNLAEDIVQNLFLHLWENADSIRIETSLKAYLYKAVKNRCLNRLRNIQVRDHHNLLYMEGILNSEDLDNGMDDEIIQKITWSIQSLPEKMRNIVMLRYSKGLKINEIAKDLSLSENTVKTQLKRAKEKIRERLFVVITIIGCCLFYLFG